MSNGWNVRYVMNGWNGWNVLKLIEILKEKNLTLYVRFFQKL